MATTDTPTPLPDAAGFILLRHYLLDLSIENPLGRINEQVLSDLTSHHSTAVRVAVPADPTLPHWVDITVHLAAQAGERIVFVAELTYRAEVMLHNVPEAEAAHVLQVQVPESLLPAFQEIISRNAFYGGYQGLVIHALDFEGAFRAAQGQAH